MKLNSYIEKAKSLLIFSMPIIMGNLGQMLIGAGDVFVAAHHGSNTVASISIANAIINTVFLIGLGLLFSLSPVLSQKLGESQDINSLFKISMFYGTIMSIIFGAIGICMVPIIPLLGFEHNLVPNIQGYILITSLSFPFAFIFQALKEFLQAKEKVFFPNMVSIFAIFLNLLLCWFFVFGLDIGVNGLAIASYCVRAAMCLTVLVYCRGYLKNAFDWDWRFIREVIRVGYPIALSLMLEVSAFSLVTLIAGKISVVQVAAHNIVLTLASITFMVPLAVSNALGVRVGYAYGAKDYKEIKETLFAGLGLSLLIMCGFASMFLAAPELLMGIFSRDTQIVHTGAALLFVVALFQIFDGTQVTLSGALRGLGYTQPIMKTMFLSYWLIGLPLGAYFAFGQRLEVLGLWIGLAIALFVCAVVFSLILHSKLRVIREINPL